MRYTIVKFESDYGPAIYRVRLHRFVWVSWLKANSGHVLNFESKAQAHAHMQTTLKRMAEPTALATRGDAEAAARDPNASGCLTRTRT